MLAINDIPDLLNQLETKIADDLEGQELDFKRWEENIREMIRILVRSVVSFANAGEGMIIVGVDANYQKVVKGIVLLIAVMFDVLSKRQKR